MWEKALEFLNRRAIKLPDGPCSFFAVGRLVSFYINSLYFYSKTGL